MEASAGVYADAWAAPRTSAERRLELMRGAERVARLGSWEWRPQTGEVVWSDNLYRLFGLEPAEIPPTREYVLEQTHPDDRERLAEAIEAIGREGYCPPVEYRIAQPSRPVRRLRSTIATVADVGSGLTSIVGAVRDVTDEVRADHKIAAHVAVSNALEEWTSLDQGARRLLRDLAEALEFHAGSLWLPVRDRLVAGAFWAAPSLDASDFESATWSLGPPRGVCLPGKTWKVAEPINLANVHKHREYARSAAATRAGLRGAVAFPALHADEVLAVVELHSREEANLSGRLMRSLRAIGYELGQFFAHRRVDLHPISLTPRQLEILRLAAQGCTGRQIAERLFISPTTVKSHFEHIYAKFGVGDRASALVAAMRYGFIE